MFEHVTELALVIAVFGAGLAVEREISRRSKRVIAALLLVVMPLTIAAITAFGVVAMGLPFAAALLLGAILAPTDPVLAGDVGLGPPGGEDQGEPRLSLHTEAGINDGLASPFILLGLFVATRGGTGWLGTWVLDDVLYAVGVAILIGVAGGWGIAAAIQRLQAREILSRDLDGFFAPATALVVYGVAEELGTYGLLAVFAAGIAFRRHEFDHQINARIHHGAETAGRLLELAVLLLLGSTLTTTGLKAPGVAGWLLAPLIILILRPASCSPSPPAGSSISAAGCSSGSSASAASRRSTTPRSSPQRAISPTRTRTKSSGQRSCASRYRSPSTGSPRHH